MPELARIVLWALGTGLISGGVWVAIVLTRRQQELAERQQAMIGDVERRTAALDQLEQRFAEVEERLDFTERLLAEEREAKRLTPPGA